MPILNQIEVDGLTYDLEMPNIDTGQFLTVDLDSVGIGEPNLINADLLGGKPAEDYLSKENLDNFYDKEQIDQLYNNLQQILLNKIPYLYKASLLANSWTDTAPYSQTAVLQSIDSGPKITSNGLIVSQVMCEQTDDQEMNDSLQEVLGIINSGEVILGDNSVTVKVWEKPSINIDAIWQIKGGSI